jgi:NMD protein affecting ribosome stability and mRNA decay
MWFSHSDLSKAKHIGSTEIIKEMVVVSKGENEIQVLDPDNLKTVDVLIPQGVKISGESVAIAKCEAGYFYIENR